MDKDYLDELLRKYEAGTCTDAEKDAVEKWYASYDKEDEMELTAGLTGQQDQLVYNKIVSRLKEGGEWNTYKAPISIQSVFRWAAAAAIIVLIGSGIYFWPSAEESKPGAILAGNQQRFKNDIDPGRDRAFLALADGSKLVLDSQQNGRIAGQGNVNIIKLSAGQVSYDKTGKTTGEIIYNTLSTPRGGQYQVVLSDGSKAWLNASSSLHFPTIFNGNERIVELKGEGYFEIAKNKAMPFKVKVDDMIVEVLGTHFNVMAYTNEQAVKTTLLEGLVKISKNEVSSFLKVGQQASVSTGTNRIDIAATDTEEVVAWKNKLFWFHDADIKTVMRQLERWYDVEIAFEGIVTKKFKGSIPMELSAVKVLTILEETGGVHFKIEGKKIYVLP